MAVRVGMKGTPMAPACSPSAMEKLVILKILMAPLSAARRKLYAEPIITLPTQAATISLTQPPAIIWSNRMSEIGPIRRSPRFFWRMISCPAAKGMFCSICRPRATLAPSGTKAATASRIVISLDITVQQPSIQHSACNRLINVYTGRCCSIAQLPDYTITQLFPLPHRLPPLHEGADSLFGVLALHQFLEVNLLRPLQALGEMRRVPGVKRLFGELQRRRAQRAQTPAGFLYQFIQFAFGDSFVGQAHGEGGVAGNFPACKNEVGGALLADDLGQHGGSHGRKAAQADFRKAPGGGLGRKSQVANRGQLRASAQTAAMDGCDGDLFGSGQHAHRAVEGNQHVANLVRRVRGHVNPGG